MSDTVLDVTDLSVGYLKHDGSLNQVVSNVSFTLERGVIMGLAGESGCGKSTTALAAIGYRPLGSRIMGGRALLGAVDLLKLPNSKLRDLWGRSVAYVAQSAALAAARAAGATVISTRPRIGRNDVVKRAAMMVAANPLSEAWVGIMI